MPGDGVSVVLCEALIGELCLHFRLPGFALASSVLRSGSSGGGGCSFVASLLGKRVFPCEGSHSPVSGPLAIV